METADKLFERAKRLSANELSRLVVLLERYLSSEAEGKGSPGEEPAGLLALSGIGDSDYSDVSSHKESTWPKPTLRGEVIEARLR